MKRNHNYFILWGNSRRGLLGSQGNRRSGLVYLLFSGWRGHAGEQILRFRPPPVERSSSEMRAHFRCWPPVTGAWPEVRPFTNWRLILITKWFY